MGTEIAKKPEAGLLPGMGERAKWEELVDVLRANYVDATDQEFAFFLHYCRSMNLDPIRRQIHLITRTLDRGTTSERKVSTIQIGIDGFRAISARTREYAGVDDYRFDEGLTIYDMLSKGRTQPVTATATVKRIIKGVIVPFTVTVAWKEFVPMGNQAWFWNQHPFSQLGKCGEAGAHRRGFPDQYDGPVYSEEELAHLVDEVEKEKTKFTLLDVPKIKIPGPDPHARQDPPPASAAPVDDPMDLPPEAQEAAAGSVARGTAEATVEKGKPAAAPPAHPAYPKPTDDNNPATKEDWASAMAATKAKHTTVVQVRMKLGYKDVFTRGQARGVIEACK